MKNDITKPKDGKKIKLIITDLEKDTIGREELDFNTIDDAKFRIIVHKINTDKDIKIKIYEDLKLVHTEYYSKPKKRNENYDKDDESYA